MPYTYDHPRPALTVDCVIFGFDEGELKVLLIERGGEPFKGRWALPGGFVAMGESLDAAARRELVEETGVRDVYLEQLYTFGDVGRDPRGRVVSVAYYALVRLDQYALRADTDARRVAWFEADDLPPLAFDHATIVAMATERLRAKVRYRPVGFELLPRRFTLTQLQHLYEAVLGRPLDKRNFRKKVLGMGLLADTGEIEQDVRHRAARLYAFDEAKYERLARRGFNFEV